jgi:CDGSH-type Zn-finger protein
MTVPNETNPDGRKWIEIAQNGPYRVHGGIPLVKKSQVVSELGEPMTWKKDGEIATNEHYSLCRCGHSCNKPFCDGMHRAINFNGTETAAMNLTAERQVIHTEGTDIVVKRDNSLCMESGFCANAHTTVEAMLPYTDDTQVRAQVMAMIERCPAGALVYALRAGLPDIEPDLPQQIALVTEYTADGPIRGPLWVTGNIEIVRSDGQPFERRNRVTLCNCGLSRNKPLCDGTHRRRPSLIEPTATEIKDASRS